MTKTVVIGTEGSWQSLAALEAAVELTREIGAVLRCLSVDDSVAEAGLDPRRRACGGGKRACRGRVVQAEAVVRAGSAADQIIVVADDATRRCACAARPLGGVRRATSRVLAVPGASSSESANVDRS